MLPAIKIISLFRIVHILDIEIRTAKAYIPLSHVLVAYATHGITEPKYKCTHELKEQFALLTATEGKSTTIPKLSLYIRVQLLLAQHILAIQYKYVL